MNGEPSRCLHATGRVRAHALEDPRVYVEQAVYPEIVSARAREKARETPVTRGKWEKWREAATTIPLSRATGLYVQSLHIYIRTYTRCSDRRNEIQLNPRCPSTHTHAHFSTVGVQLGKRG